MIHKYFITYIFNATSETTGPTNFGNTVVSRENITDMDDILSIEKEIKEALEEKVCFGVNVIVLNWRRMEDPE